MDLSRRDFLKTGLAVGAALVLPGEKAAQAVELPSVLWFSWDGADWRSVLPMLRAGEMPNLAQLYAVRLECGGCSLTKPGHVEAITGFDYFVTKVHTNRKYKEVPRELSAFSRIKEAYPDYWCGVIFSHYFNTGDSAGEPWKPLGDWARAGGLNYYWNNRQTGPGSSPFYRTYSYFLEALNAYTAPGLLYIHWSDPDKTGHEDGMDSPRWHKKLLKLDNALGEAIQAVKPDYIVLYSDHGFDGPGMHHHKNAPHGFVACNFPLITNGVRRDVGYTVMQLLNLPVETYAVGKHLLQGKNLQYFA